MRRYCMCGDWEPQTEIIDGALQWDQLHSFTAQDYTNFKMFVYCPWCGNLLFEEETTNR
jgi:hypothetical protein